MMVLNGGIYKELTFDKLISLRANTANALNSTPGPSSNVKTILVLKTKKN
ncbi:hypothetical protein HanIR_Chr01g0007721 [Helianthus annuus]|nr:hypothetical protein HanIR_Chr01g0007721 [Helianthus annuus]